MILIPLFDLKSWEEFAEVVEGKCAAYLDYPGFDLPKLEVLHPI